jgi:hypothetical protein
MAADFALALHNMTYCHSALAQFRGRGLNSFVDLLMAYGWGLECRPCSGMIRTSSVPNYDMTLDPLGKGLEAIGNCETMFEREEKHQDGLEGGAATTRTIRTSS